VKVTSPTEISTQKVPYSARDRQFSGFLADGSGGHKAPGILVVHEGRGFTQHPRDRALMLAELGYVAYAPDFMGDVATSLEHAFDMMRPFEADRSLFAEHGREALEVLKTSPNVDRDRLGAIGFCWGGYAVLELACHAPLRCIIGFHPGLTLGPLSDAKAIEGSVMICVGDEDPYVPMSDIQRFKEEMRGAGVDCQVNLLVGAPHSFSNPEPYAYEIDAANVGYDAKADGRVWKAMQLLFNESF